FILGFTPLQIHRRNLGDASRDTPVAEDELSQLARLASYGVIANITPDVAPRLEASGATKQPRNVHELRFQAYATGNCAHCHNQKGYAWNQGITLALAPPGVFQFPPTDRARVGSGRFLAPGNPDGSALYQHVAQDTSVQ